MITESQNIFPDHLRAEYDVRVLNKRERRAKARQLQRALELAGVWKSNPKILDVGCGSGHMLSALDTTSSRRVGCDLRADLYLQARGGQRAMAFVQSDAAHLPFRQAEFDLVLCLAAIEEFEDWQNSLSTLARCVAPGGLLCLTLTNGRQLIPLYWIAEKFGRQIPEAWWRYARASVKIELGPDRAASRVACLHPWHFVNVTPYLAQARLHWLRFLPVPLLAFLLKFAAPSFAYAWQRPND